MTITRECPMCGTITIIEVEKEGFNAWRKGELIQRAMPEVDLYDRETLILGICAACQDEFFGAGDEEDF